MLAGKGKVQSYRLLLSNRATKHYQFCTPREALFIMPPGRDNGPTSCLLFFCHHHHPGAAAAARKWLFAKFLASKKCATGNNSRCGQKNVSAARDAETAPLLFQSRCADPLKCVSQLLTLGINDPAATVAAASHRR